LLDYEELTAAHVGENVRVSPAFV